MRYAGLDSAAQLHVNPDRRDNRIPYRYNDRADSKRYGLVLLEPVAVYAGPDAQFGKVPLPERQALADYMQVEFEAALGKAFQLTNVAGPDTLRIKLTLTGAKASKKFLAAASRFDIGGGSYNLVQSIRGKEGAMSGSVTYAVEVYDAQSGRLLDAYVSKQYPNAMNVKANIGALSASKKGIQLGAEELVATLAKTRAR
ncbi:MAG: DUF3313 domain-containing protein [Pseudoxanthomonas sp.]|nr:DUF3313 domain-containing protein [Pseudoxanthomonas sp.]WDS35315.1 MAG: DUF3313 domain-containing protein [Pseudoxanthomonas sp.]